MVACMQSQCWGGGGDKEISGTCRLAILACLVSSRQVKDSVSKKLGGRLLRSNNLKVCLPQFIHVYLHAHEHACMHKMTQKQIKVSLILFQDD